MGHLRSKIVEALISALPISLIVYVISFLPWFSFSNSDLISMSGPNMQKAVILSVVREDMVESIIKCLDEKFETIRNGKGIAFTVPLSSVIGVSMYQFLSNNLQTREG